MPIVTTISIPTPMGSGSDVQYYRLEPRKIFIEGDTISLDIDVSNDDTDFNVSEWAVSAILLNPLGTTQGIFNTLKFQDDTNRVRVTATYRQEQGNLVKDFYLPIPESIDYLVSIKLVRAGVVRNVLPIPIFIQRRGIDG